MNTEPVRLVVVAVIAVLAALQGFELIDADTEANITGLLTLLIGGEVARAKVRPVRS